MSSTFVLLDERGPSFIYHGDWYPSVVDGSNIPWYNLTSMTPYHTGDKVNGTPNLSITFEGTGLSLIGIGDPPDTAVGRNMRITLDPDTPESTRLALPQPPMMSSHYREFYTTPNLTESLHTIHFNSCEWQDMDLGLVRVGLNSPLHGKTLLVDDSDSQIEYLGVGWYNNASLITGGHPLFFDPILKSSHQTVSPGDMITFRFYGTAVSVWGIFSWWRISNIIVMYTLDGRSEQRSYPVTGFSPYYQSRQDALHFLYYSAKDLTPTLHVLTVNVTVIQNTTFCFDYITYEPSFANLASMPFIPSSPPPAAYSSLSYPSPTIQTLTANRNSPLIGKVVAWGLV